MKIKTIYLIIQGKYKDKKGKLYNIVTYTDSLEKIEKYKDEILGYEVASVYDLNNSEVFDDTFFGTNTLRVKEGIVEHNKYIYIISEDEHWLKDDLDKNTLNIVAEDDDCLEIGIWDLINKENNTQMNQNRL